jgi:thiosulfate/3-mercaptopyruvate sulfurtransferase
MAARLGNAMEILVSAEWLSDALGAPDLKVLDATYFALDPSRDARAEYETSHIPTAIFMDLPSLKDADNPVPFMLPPAEKFAERMRALGVSDDDRIILYDNTAHRTAARAWWMLKTCGTQSVAILDGGLANWLAEDRPIEIGSGPTPCAGDFIVHPDFSFLRSIDQIKANVETGAEQLLDARGKARFTGEEADPRPEVAPGHIPGSRSLPYDQLFNANGTWKRGDALRTAFENAGIDLSRPLVTTCGSGVTAAVLLFGAALLGKADVALYDGSWSEWGADPSTPKATGEA